MTGKVTFVGGGTGDGRLLTLRAAEVLASADFILFDPTVHPDVLGHLREGAPRQPIESTMRPEQIAQLLAREAEQGRHAVRLFWADPLLFGTGDEEAIAVARYRVPIEIVPGIGPLAAVGAFAGCPLTRTNDASPSVAAVFVTDGHEGLHDWHKLATATDTLALLCDAESVGEVARSLVFFGRSRDEPATVIENVSLATQRIEEVTLGEVPLLARRKASPVLLVVGERARRVPELAWTEGSSLFGLRVLVTRARNQASALASLLRERGADPVVVPTIELHPPTDPAPMVDAVAALDARYDWIVVTSANGVERLWAEIRRQGKDARLFAASRVAAVGPGTAAALERIGLAPDLVAKDHKGEGLAEALVDALARERASPTPSAAAPRVLVARAEVARDVVPDALRRAGCSVDVVAVYKTQSPPRPLLAALASLLEGREIDVVTFTSSSTVEHLCEALDGRATDLLANTTVASIGPITTETARRLGVRVDVTATEHTVAGLVEALESYTDLRQSGPRSVVRRV